MYKLRMSISQRALIRYQEWNKWGQHCSESGTGGTSPNSTASKNLLKGLKNVRVGGLKEYIEITYSGHHFGGVGVKYSKGNSNS